MAEDSQSGQERTESPTPKRRQQARDEGQLAKSHEMSVAAIILAGTVALGTVGGVSLATFATQTLTRSARSLSGGALTPTGAATMIQETMIGLMTAMLPFAAVVMAVGILVNAMQARGVITWKPLQPKLTRLNPASGVKRMFSPEAAFRLVTSILKVAALGAITYFVIVRSLGELVSLTALGTEGIATMIQALLVRLALAVGLAFFAISTVDYAFQLRRHESRLRMSRQDVKRDHRESEGDPLVKSRILAMARSLARKRMMQQVPTADVVIVNPTHIAVALRYDLDVAPAPMVVAMGRRKIAERIKRLALDASVPVIENRTVAQALIATAKLGQPIPPALYAAVAEILAFVYRSRGLPRLQAGLQRGGRP